MKMYIRRFVFALITSPIAVTAYGILYFGLALIPETNTTTVGDFVSVIPHAVIVYVIFLTFFPQLMRIVNKVVE